MNLSLKTQDKIQFRNGLIKIKVMKILQMNFSNIIIISKKRFFKLNKIHKFDLKMKFQIKQ